MDCPGLELSVSDGLVGQEGEAATDGAGLDEAQAFHAAGLAKEALAGPDHKRVDRQPQLVDEVMLHQCAHEPSAGVDDDLAVHPLLQVRHLAHHVALQDR